MSNLHRGAQQGEGVYTTLLWQGGPPPTWPLHLARLQRDAAQVDLPPPPIDELPELIAQHLSMLAEEAARGDSLWRLRIRWWGDGDNPLVAPAQRGLWDLQLRRLAASERPGVPVRLASAGPARFPRRWAGAKLVSIGEDLAWRRWAIAQGYDDALLCDLSGCWSETPTAAVLVGLLDGRVGAPGPETSPVRSTTLQALAQQIQAQGGPPLVPLALGPAERDQVAWMLLLNAVAGGRPVAAVDGAALQPPPRLWVDLAQDLTQPCSST